MADKWREKNTILMCGMICTTLIICGILFWPTLYRYDKTESKLVRINRITGDTHVLEKRGLGREVWYEWTPTIMAR
jgi:hypothetical protein